MPRMIIVSNRLPLSVKDSQDGIEIVPSSGGLATGLRGPHARNGSVWIGWPGDLSALRMEQKTALTSQFTRAGTVPVTLSRSQVRGFYDGFSNGVLWPLFHHLADAVDRDASRNWKTYEEVNRHFAEVVAAAYRPGDVIWVHDYQLCLLPRLLRERLPDAEIGFFLHIPFPSSESFRILPWRAALLEGMLGADLIGFHTAGYRRHFCRALLMVLGRVVEDDGVMCDGRRVQLGVFPMGIDAGQFMRDAVEPAIQAEVGRIRHDLGDQRLLLGVDRLDYTKGLPRRLLALDRLLEAHPHWRGKLRLVQVIVPSRTGVASYDRLRRELDEMVGRINGRYSTSNWVPVHNIFRSLNRAELVGLYAGCDVMLVTPLRDGMNLVAKEFVACRADNDGVLLLSEFAGAAAELVEAIHVNPYDVDGVASAIDRALTMPREDRKDRMERMRARVSGYDAYRWSQQFVDTLHAARLSRTPTSGPSSIRTLVTAAKKAPHVALLLGYDGTLVPYAAQPEQARPDDDLLRLLTELAQADGVQVHIVSGRSAPSLEEWLGHLPIHLHAEHGFWSCRPGKRAWVPLHPPVAPWKDEVREIMARYSASTKGSRIEEKTSSIVWHYRNSDVEWGATQAQRLATELEPLALACGLEVLSGVFIVELRVHDTHKGVVPRQLGDLPDGSCIVAMGDDRTDEDLFAALPPGAFAIHVGSGLSRASIRLPDHGVARELLRTLMTGRTRAHSSR